MCSEPFDSRAKAPPAKRSQKGYGDENEDEPKEETRARETTREDESEEEKAPRLSSPSFFFLSLALFICSPPITESLEQVIFW